MVRNIFLETSTGRKFVIASLKVSTAQKTKPVQLGKTVRVDLGTLNNILSIGEDGKLYTNYLITRCWALVPGARDYAAWASAIQRLGLITLTEFKEELTYHESIRAQNSRQEQLESLLDMADTIGVDLDWNQYNKVRLDAHLEVFVPAGYALDLDGTLTPIPPVTTTQVV